ncbi:hypothetical protein EYC80_001106 [Monilinia laxa]|uniref:Uncharacterized protein n=1 Tax=Monilinia laxa TaxID=61186 RepID=A0A5N6K8A5_MONLA|nr:hypothetical protein EYC80_001106 [Monilinia laxa]
MYSDLPPESQEFLPDPVATPTQRLKKPGQERGRTRSFNTHSTSVSPVHNNYPNYEDILARSPAREQLGQQRPFLLILPHGSTANSQSSRSSTPPIPPPKDEPVISIDSTIVPLSSDEFLQLNENIDIDRFPLPPSPPQHSLEWYRNRNLSVATDDGLQRSGTGRSLVSAVSQISDSPSQAQTDNLAQNILHVDGENNMKRDSGNLYDTSPELPREHMKLVGRYTRRQGETEMSNRGSYDAGAEDGGDINQEVKNECVEKETDRPKEERLQMSATSYPGMEWNPYAAGYAGDD